MIISKSVYGAFASAISISVFLLAFVPQAVKADIALGLSSVEFEFGGQALSIRRATSGETTLPSQYTQTDRTCPEHCIEPGTAAAGVTTLTELEVFAFMQKAVSSGSGPLVDARLPEEYAAGTIPGAISVPAATLVGNNPYREDLLLALGAKGAIGQMDFAGAFDLMIFDDGPWSPTARQAVQLLLDAGYPAQKILYYRGGLQMWHVLGLTVSK
ncbi:rhodanese-like domain-containing protein [Planktotalea sp.]|uniref:rhodanese-like domain-containing protein n=1 Tax=Planktotalea sp. TaxID=2029877 RepID=UPI0035C7BC81